MPDKSHWQPQIPINQGIYDADTTQRADLGTRLPVGDRVFYYAKAGEECLATEPVVHAVTNSGHTDEIFEVSAAAGATQLTVSNSLSIAAGTYDEGYLAILSETGGMYRISSQYVMNSVTGYIELYDPIKYSHESDGIYSLILPLYKDCIPANAAVTQLLLGIAPINVASGSYFWLQTWGPCVANTEGAVVEGDVYTLGTTDADVLTVAEAVSLLSNGPTAGVGIGAGNSSTTNGPLYLTIRN